MTQRLDSGLPGKATHLHRSTCGNLQAFSVQQGCELYRIFRHFSLTGSTPLEKAELKDSALNEILRMI